MELIWIADAQSNFLVVYGSDRRGRIEMLAWADLDEIFAEMVEQEPESTEQQGTVESPRQSLGQKEPTESIKPRETDSPAKRVGPDKTVEKR